MDPTKKRKVEVSDVENVRGLAEQYMQVWTPEEIKNLLLDIAETVPGALEVMQHKAREDPNHKKLFIHGLKYETTNETLREIFGAYGPMKECTIVKDNNTGNSKGFGFIVYDTMDAAYAALTVPNRVIDGRECHLHLAYKKEDLKAGKVGGSAAAGAMPGFNAGVGGAGVRAGSGGGGKGNMAQMQFGAGAGMGGMPGMAGIGGVGGMAGLAGMPGMAGMAGMGGMVGMPGMAGMNAMGGLTGMAGLAGLPALGGVPGVGLENRKLFVRGLNFETTTQRLYQIFSVFGTLDECEVCEDKKTGKSRGYGFLLYRKMEDAMNAVNMAPPTIDGRNVVVHIAYDKSKGEGPPSAGGTGGAAGLMTNQLGAAGMPGGLGGMGGVGGLSMGYMDPPAPPMPPQQNRSGSGGGGGGGGGRNGAGSRPGGQQQQQHYLNANAQNNNGNAAFFAGQQQQNGQPW